ncbi:MAG: DMT family transporter [Verrucomicrobia bacterium]|nr:DMT family transporter [Verrucomicrobiota bacterium]
MTAISYLFCCLAVVAAAVSVALQQVLNTNLRSQLESPWWAGRISYAVGTVVMLTLALTSAPPRLSGAFSGATSWLSWTGGFFGAIFIATAIFMVPRLGAATVLALIVVGQMLGSLTLDHFGILGIPQHAVSLTRLIGAAFLILGVFLIRI